jgi:hypothetical protein
MKVWAWIQREAFDSVGFLGSRSPLIRERQKAAAECEVSLSRLFWACKGWRSRASSTLTGKPKRRDRAPGTNRQGMPVQGYGPLSECPDHLRHVPCHPAPAQRPPHGPQNETGHGGQPLQVAGGRPAVHPVLTPRPRSRQGGAPRHPGRQPHAAHGTSATFVDSKPTVQN